MPTNINLYFITFGVALGTTILVTMWTIIPTIETVIPYIKTTKRSGTLIPRLAIRTMLILFFARMAIVHGTLAMGNIHGIWMYHSDIIIMLLMIATIIISIKVHPNGIRGL